MLVQLTGSASVGAEEPNKRLLDPSQVITGKLDAALAAVLRLAPPA